VLEIVREQVRREKDIRAIRAGRQRIADGVASVALQDVAEDEPSNDPPEPLPPPETAPEPRVRPHEWRGKLMNTLLPDGYRTMRERAEHPQWQQMHEPEVRARVNGLRPEPKQSLPAPVLARDMRPRLSAGGSLVKGLLDEGAMSVIYAPSNVGKSFLMLDLAFHIATGRDWRGLRIKKPGAVLYIAAEGGYGFINRVIAVKRHYGLPDDADIPLAVLPCPVDLLDAKADRDAIVRMIDDVTLEFEQPVVLLVLDTLSRLMTGGDENSAKDMTAFVANADYIRQNGCVHTAIVHHAGKDIAKGARGHSSLRAATDTEIELVRAGEGMDKTFSVTVKKQRELSGDEVFMCNLKSVLIGTDEDGDAVTSAVVEHSAAESPARVSTDAKIRHNVNDKALDILAGLIATQGHPLPASEGYPAGVSGVTEEVWRRECDAQRLSKAEADTSRDRVFRRAFDQLHFKAAIGTRDGLVWLAT
jgi:hypothetical protein